MNLTINHRFPEYCDNCPCLKWLEDDEGASYDAECKMNYRVEYNRKGLFRVEKPYVTFFQTKRPQECIKENGL